MGLSMLFLFVCGRWHFDPNGQHNLAFVREDAAGLHLTFVGRRVPVALVAPD